MYSCAVHFSAFTFTQPIVTERVTLRLLSDEDVDAVLPDSLNLRATTERRAPVKQTNLVTLGSQSEGCSNTTKPCAYDDCLHFRLLNFSCSFSVSQREEGNCPRYFRTSL